VFSFTDLKKEYKLVKYNKSLRNKLEINSLYFKTLSGKYVIFEKNGIAKEYNPFDTKIFEGEYLNGKRWNGKGREKYGNINFEGEYFEGKLWNGKVTEYDFDWECLFSGEYLNGKRWIGKGKEYDNYGNLIFEGEYLNGQRWNGKEYNSEDNFIYEEEYIKGQKFNKIKKENKIIKVLFVNEDSLKHSGITVRCSLYEKVSSVIKRYREKIPYRIEPSFVFNARRLKKNSTILQEEIKDNSTIFVIEGKM
jgi:hypothetical protein